MAVLRAFEAVDMRDPLAGGVLLSSDAGSIVFFDGVRIERFTGSFGDLGLTGPQGVSPRVIDLVPAFPVVPSFPGFGAAPPAVGIDGYAQTIGGATVYEVSDIGLPARLGVVALLRGDSDLFRSLAFAGDDVLFGSRRADVLLGYAGNDAIAGGDGGDRLVGNRGFDRLSGGDGDDRLSGGRDRDVLSGGDGRDLLVGGSGGDRLSGGDGSDIFRFRAASDSRPDAGRRDVIEDFGVGDLIDLRRIDADVGARGNQKFVFIDDAGFSGTAGELRWSGDTLSGDLDGDGARDFAIGIDGSPALTAADILL